MQLATPTLHSSLVGSSQQLYIIRHGETDYNVRGVVQGGGIDSDLNEKGRWQAERFFSQYHSQDFDLVCCSALKRTHQTVAAFVAAGTPVCYDARLNEMGWGQLEGAEADAEVMHTFKEALAKWEQGHLDWGLADGETPNQVAARCWAGLTELMALHPHKKILVCTHGRVLRIVLCLLLGYPLTQMQHFKHSNTALNLVRRTGHAFTLDKVNDTSHLSEHLS